MIELPEGYDLKQAYNDLMYLAVRLQRLEEFAENIWEAVRDEHYLQEGINSFGMNNRLLEVEEKYRNLTEYIGHTAMPAITKLNERFDKTKGYTIE